MDAYIHGRRVVRSFRTKREAEDRYFELAEERTRKAKPKVNPFSTVKDFAPRFLADCERAELAPSSMKTYTAMIHNRIIPALGHRPVREIRAPEIRDFLLDLRQRPTSIQGQKGSDRTPNKALTKATMLQVHAILSGLLAFAVEELIITTNPARGLWRPRKTQAKRARHKAPKVRAMTREQRDAFLEAAVREPEAYAAFLIGFLAGLRRGEILGLTWRDVDFQGRRLHVHRQLMSRTTKTGAERFVEMAVPLADYLAGLQAQRRAEAFRRGEAWGSGWCFRGSLRARRWGRPSESTDGYVWPWPGP